MNCDGSQWRPSSSNATLSPRSAKAAAPHEPTLAGIDVLAAEGFARLRGKRVGLLTNHTGRSRDGVSTIDLIAGAPGVTLAALFSPEHGIRGALDASGVANRKQARSRYGAKKA